MRAVRADKTTYAALEATLALWVQPARRSEIPVYRMLTTPLPEIETRADRLASSLSALDGVTVQVIAGASTTGGGSAPDSVLETRLVCVTADRVTASRLDERLRASDPPIVGRIERDRLVLDVRTLSDDETGLIAPALSRAVEGRDGWTREG